MLSNFVLGQTEKTNNNIKEIAIPLSKFVYGSLSFYSTEDSQTFYFPYRKGLFLLKNAIIDLDYYHSEQILSEISQIILKINDEIICQRTLHKKLPAGNFKCEIPAHLLKTGYNKIEIKTSLHYDKECEIPTVKFLWLKIDTKKSVLKFKIQENKKQLTIKETCGLLSELNIQKPKVNFIFPSYERDSLELIGLLTAKIALMRNFQDAKIEISSQPKLGYINIVLLINNKKPNFLLSDSADNFSGIKVYQKDNSIFFIFSAKNKKELKDLVNLFVFSDLILPEKNKWSLEELQKQKNTYQKLFRRNLLRSHEKTTFNKKGLIHISFVGLISKEKGIYIKIAPELYLAENKFAILGLHFSYSAGLRQDSTLHILLNGKLINSIALDDPEGKIFEDYKIYIPLSQFRPGSNFLSFKTFLKPRKAEKCSPLIAEAFRVDIFGDSYIEMPTIGIYHQMPDLNSFFDTGFPYTFWLEQGEKVSIIIENDKYIRNFLELVYFLTQQVKSIPYFYIKQQNNIKDKHFIYIGSKISLSKLKNKLKNFSVEKEKILVTQGIINENPFQEGTIILCPKYINLKDILNKLKARKIIGDTIIYDVKQDYLIELNLQEPYEIGHKPLKTKLQKRFFKKPELFYIIISTIIFILVIIISIIIWKRKKERLQA